MTELIDSWLARQAERRPEHVAVVMADEAVTYGDVEESSVLLAHMLIELGCRRGDRIGVLLPKSALAIIAFHGALKAGCVYVPIDISNPPSRVARIMEACRPKVVLAADPAAELLAELQECGPEAREAHVGWMAPDLPPEPRVAAAFSLRDLQSLPKETPRVQRRSGDPAHILFTSGSTGNPKGVVVAHRNVVAFIDWAREYFGIAPSDRASGHSPFHFDLSTFDIFGTFSAGATLHLVPKELNLLPNKLADFIRQSELTQWFSVPSVLNYMAKFDVVAPNDFPTLDRLLWCGEVFPTPALMYWMRRLPHVRFTNLYGPTETTIASSFFTVPSLPEDPRLPVPIGSAIRGEQLLILDEFLCAVAPGELGDLYIGGVGVTLGYWEDPDKTRECFVQRREGTIYKTGDLARIGDDGLIHFVGRADTQIKSRGYRIELGEIEAALNTVECLKECAVVAIETEKFGGTAICCAYAVSDNAQVVPSDLRRLLSRHLPSYMLPAYWAEYPGLARNASGKIDRRRIKEDFSAREGGCE
jgi:amino acid adenylation domain-containing protein